MPNRKQTNKSRASSTPSKVAKQIPAPPGPEASCEEIDEYFSTYSMEDLDRAELTRPLKTAETAWVNKITKAAKENIEARQGRSQLNLALPTEQLLRFTQYANKKH